MKLMVIMIMMIIIMSTAGLGEDHKHRDYHVFSTFEPFACDRHLHSKVFTVFTRLTFWLHSWLPSSFFFFLLVPCRISPSPQGYLFYFPFLCSWVPCVIKVGGGGGGGLGNPPKEQSRKSKETPAEEVIPD